jgi:hypothetical protein
VLALLLGIVIAIIGAIAGGLVAVAVTAWIVPDDPFAIVVLGLALLLVRVPLGPVGSLWLVSAMLDERSTRSS